MKDVSRLLDALTDPTRLRLLRLLRRQELCVCELMDALRMPQPRMSHQLRILKDAGLITDRREGKWMIYALEAAGEEEPASALLQLLREAREGEVFARDRDRLRETLAKGLWACGRAYPRVEES